MTGITYHGELPQDGVCRRYMYLSISAITACNLAQELQKMRVCAVGLRREGMSGGGMYLRPCGHISDRLQNGDICGTGPRLQAWGTCLKAGVFQTERTGF